MEVRRIALEKLLEHEEVDAERVETMKSSVLAERFIPIVVTKVKDEDRYVILDGHHRFRALKDLSQTEIPCIVVDYTSVGLDFWREEYSKTTKEDVIESALAGRRFPTKTTRHRFDFDPNDYAVSLSDGG